MAALTVICAVCLTVACVQIYNSGASPFSPESIADAFAKIAIPVYIFLAEVLVGIVLWLISPENEAKAHGYVDLGAKAQKLRANLPSSSEGEAAIKKANKEARLRICYLTASAVICAVTAIYPIVHILNRDNFSASDINAEILAATLSALPFVIVCFVLLTVYAKVERDSLEREITALRSVAKSGVTDSGAPSKQSKRLLLCIRLTVLVVGIVFVVLGVLNGGANDVLQKAVRICTECIGLG